MEDSNVQLEVTRSTLQLDFSRQAELLSVMKQVAEHYYGALGSFYYEGFEHINWTHFGGDLPVPLLQVAMTPYGRCLGYTLSRESRQPVIRMHPNLIKKGNAGEMLYNYEVLLHECCHIAVDYIVGAGMGDTSHNCEGWLELVNKLSPEIGLTNINAQPTKAIREGKAVRKGTIGNVSQGDLSRWPHSLREPSYYAVTPLPFELTVPMEQVIADGLSIRH
jgi:hypothetical protein